MNASEEGEPRMKWKRDRDGSGANLHRSETRDPPQSSLLIKLYNHVLLKLHNNHALLKKLSHQSCHQRSFKTFRQKRGDSHVFEFKLKNHSHPNHCIRVDVGLILDGQDHTNMIFVTDVETNSYSTTNVDQIGSNHGMSVIIWLMDEADWRLIGGL